MEPIDSYKNYVKSAGRVWPAFVLSSLAVCFVLSQLMPHIDIFKYASGAMIGIIVSGLTYYQKKSDSKSV